MPPQMPSCEGSGHDALLHHSHCKHSHSKDHCPEADGYPGTTKAARIFVLLSILAVVVFRELFQDLVDALWAAVREDPYFCSTYFETVYVGVVYTLLMVAYPFAMHHITWLDRFKVAEDVTYIHRSLRGILGELLVFLLPLLVADTVIVKRYWFVDPAQVASRKLQWVQTTRPLPWGPPNVLIMCVQVVASVVVFDALFFLVHLALHKHHLLYRYIHACHHQHELMHPHVTNQLSVTERVLLIACANYSLKLWACHPLTRLVFVPVFLWLLLENHTGYDLPWAPHRLAPASWMGGPAKHHAHHRLGSAHYQPFFNYLDQWLERKRDQARKET